MTTVEIKVENIVASAALGKSLDLPQVAPAWKELNITQNNSRIGYKLKEPKTQHSYSDQVNCLYRCKINRELKESYTHSCRQMRALDAEIPKEFEIKVQNIVASANLGKTLNLESVALDLENTEYEPEQFQDWFTDLTTLKLFYFYSAQEK